MGRLRTTLPKVALLGLMSRVDRLLHPLLVTTAIGENGPLANWSAMATELGAGAAQATRISTALMTKKSVALDWTPPLITSSAKSCGMARNGTAGIVTVMIRPLGSTLTLLDGIGVPSRRTCAPATKPVPKIWTPARSLAEVRVPCGTKAFG